MSNSFLAAAIRATFSGFLTSVEMLVAACDRCFVEPLLALLESFTSGSASGDKLLGRAECVAQLGHHSGFIILLGMVEVWPAHEMVHFET